jgi:hypothetical protein
VGRDQIREMRYDAHMTWPKVRLVIFVAWMAFVMYLAPVKHWEPLVALGLYCAFCATTIAKWPGKPWVTLVVGIVTVIYCLPGMWRPADNASTAFSGFFAMVALDGIFGIFRRRLLSSPRGGPPPSA